MVGGFIVGICKCLCYINFRGDFMILVLKLIGLVTLLLLMKAIFKKQKFSKIKKSILIFVFVLLFVVVIFIPLESMLCYETSEDVYYHNVKSDYMEMIEGQDSCAFLYQTEDNSFSELFVLKDGDKYKKCPYFDAKRIYSKFSNGVVVDLIHVKNTSDYYLLVWDIANDIQISDNLNTDFNLIYRNFANQTAVICMESIIYDSDYELYINNAVIDFD